MNLFVRSSTQINPVAADISYRVDVEREYKMEHAHSFHGTQSLPPGNTGDEKRGAGEFGSIWTRMAIEDHADFPAEEGCILMPYRDLPENWSSAPDFEALNFLDREFVFPGEHSHILIHVNVQDNTENDRITPFKVAAALKAKKGTSEATLPSDEDSSVGVTQDSENEKVDGSKTVELENGAHTGADKEYAGEGSSEVTIEHELDSQEGVRVRSQKLLESFRKSHFYVQILASEEEQPPVRKKMTSSGSGEDDDSSRGAKVSRNVKNYGATPVLMERGTFNPQVAGGVARNAVACTTLPNGNLLVLLEVSFVSECITDDAYLEVLQFEKHEPPAVTTSEYGYPEVKRGCGDLSEGLLQWLLPLDRPSSPPPAVIANSIQNSPSKLSVSGGNSTLFSFSNLRTSSSGQMAPLVSAPILPVSTTSYSSPAYGTKEWDSASQERSGRTEVGSEGLLSFRGAVLEPQRFSAHYGLEGPHVPGKKWRRKLSIIQPVKLDSYSARCNTQDLICVLVENILPVTGKTADVVIYVDSVNIVCESAASGSSPLAVPISCVEIGNDHQLPGLALRPGEQHSFIVRPTNPGSRAPILFGGKTVQAGFSAPKDMQPYNGPFIRSNRSGNDASLPVPEGGQYAVIISCHCSHTESRLHYKHPLQWRPTPPRDLLLSVSLESPPSEDFSIEQHSLFQPQVVTVQATNLTSEDMNLTLHAPSCLTNSSVSFPTPLVDSPITASFNKQKSFRAPSSRDGKDREDILSDVSQSPEEDLDLPPVRRMESVIGMSPTVTLRDKNVSAADMVADNSAARTHLWLQSRVPMGYVPAYATATVRCEILPLTDGIITLDTLHISANGSDSLYVPESPLQVYATSSISTGVA